MSNVRLPILHGEPAKAAAEPALPEELRAPAAAMQVGDLARETGKTVRAIHLYEEMDLLRPTGRSKGRYRLYGPEALVRIRWIVKLQDLGFSLTDIKTIVKEQQLVEIFILVMLQWLQFLVISHLHVVLPVPILTLVLLVLLIQNYQL